MDKLIQYLKLSGLILFLTFTLNKLNAQVAPQAEPVYGGYVENMDAIPLSATSTRVFVSTMSPNSMFYGTMTNVNTSTPSFSGWSTVPDLDWNDDHGHLRFFAVDENSEFIYAQTQEGEFIACDITSSSLYTIGSYWIEALEAYDSRLFYEKHYGPDEWLYVSDLDASGNILNVDSTLIAASPGWSYQFDLQIHINPYNDHVYFFVPGTPPIIYKSSDTYSTISNTTTWTAITVSDLAATGKEYVSMGIAPDGRIFAGSYEGNSSGFTAQVSYTDVDGDPWTTNSIANDCGRGEISIAGTSAGTYNVFFSRVYSTDKGTTWNYHGGADGAICADPINENYAYVRTDWGMGYFSNYSTSVNEINTGMQAVQVNDFAMDYTKDTAWVASKSGLWYVYDYSTPTPVWSNPIWPQYSTVPWTEVETYLDCDPMYCGNTNGDVFKWSSAYGSPINPGSFQTVFEAHLDASYPYYTWTYGTYVSAIAHDPNASNERIFVGLYDNEDWNEPEALGAVFYGEFLSGSWVFDQIVGPPMLYDGCDVNDIVVVTESGNTVAYVGVERNTTFGTVNGVYRIEETAPYTWSISNDLFTGPGYPISATIVDLHVSANDTIFCCGTDASGTSVRSYKKAIGDTYWTALTSSGLTSPNTGRAITYDDTYYDVYMAVDNEIYVLTNGASSWLQYSVYPVGTQIQFIYYDDLLVGTGTGLYVHYGSVGINVNKKESQSSVSVFPNPFSDKITFNFKDELNEVTSLKIYNESGKVVYSVPRIPAGTKDFVWDGKNMSGYPLEGGIYFYSFKSSGMAVHGKISKK